MQTKKASQVCSVVAVFYSTGCCNRQANCFAIGLVEGSKICILQPKKSSLKLSQVTKNSELTVLHAC